MKRFKKITAILLMLILLVGCASGGGQNEQQDSSKNDNENSVSSSTSTDYKNQKTVLCFGDSITNGFGMALTSEPYPAVLQEKLGDEYKVYNAGVGGEKMAAIMSRSNTTEFSLGEDLVFDANDATAKLSLVGGLVVTESGEAIDYKGTGNQLPITVIVINGVEYQFTRISGSYTVTRTDTAEPLIIPKGTRVEYDYSRLFNDCYCAVLLMGANDGDVGAQRLIEQYTAFGKKFERCIFITPFYYTDYADEFDAAFGRNTINIREYFRGQVFEDYGLEKDRLAQHYINKTNGLPTIFTFNNNPNDVHLSALGYKVMGGEVYKRGVELGYWE